MSVRWHLFLSLAFLASGVTGCLCSAADAKTIRVEADFMALKSSVKTYRLDTGQLPPPEMGLEALITRPPFLPKDARWSKIMDAPLKDPWGNPYRYVAGDGVPEGFGFYSCGPDGVSSSLGHDPDDRNSWEDPDGRDKPPLPDHWKPWLSLGGGALAIVSFLLGRRSGAAGLRRLQRVA